MPDQTTSRGLRWPALAGILISIVLLTWTLRDVRPGDVVGHVGNANAWALLGMTVFATLTFVVRTFRWRAILHLDGQELPWMPLWHATAIGFMANNLLPARTGEVARAYAVTKMTGVPFSTAAATIVVARVMDGLTVLVLLVLGAALSGLTITTSVGGIPLRHIVFGAGAFFGILLVGAIIAAAKPAWALGVIRRVLPVKMATRVTGVVEGLLRGLTVLNDRRRALVVMGWSVLVWSVNGLSFWLCAVAFDLPVPWAAALVLQSLIAFGVAVPSSPGFFGPFEAVTRATLQLYGVSAGLAVSYAVTYHLLTFLPITLLGLWSLTRAHLHLRDLARRATPASAPEPQPPGSQHG